METRETDILNIFDFPTHHFPDRSARWLLQDKENVRGLIEIVAEQIAAHIDFNRLTQHNRSLISDTLREQESDLIFSVPFHSGSETDELIIYILSDSLYHNSPYTPIYVRNLTFRSVYGIL